MGFDPFGRARLVRGWVAGLCVGAVVTLAAAQKAPSAGAVASPQSLDLSLRQAVALAVAQNKTVRSAYLDRVSQRYVLKVAEYRFVPLFEWSSAVSRLAPTGAASGVGQSTSSGLTARQVLPLGGQADLSVTASRQPGAVVGEGASRGTTWTLSVLQPLLKGAGWEVAHSPVTLAQLAEQQNMLTLKAVVGGVVAEVIAAYHQYARALGAEAIARESVARAERTLETYRALMAAGRVAAVDIVQFESDLANQAYARLAAENATESARLALARLLGLAPDQPLRLETLRWEAPTLPTVEEALQGALVERTDALGLEIGLVAARLRLRLARNQQLPDLSAVASWTGIRSRNAPLAALAQPDSWSAGLRLTVPLNDPSIRLALVMAQTDLDKTELAQAQLRESIEVEIRNAVRGLDLSWRQYKLAEAALKLSERKFEIETEKLRVGRSSNFQLIAFQNDLLTAQNNVLNSGTAYLDAQTSLERARGLLLARWDIALEER
jgi:outer membrane protein TolC